MKAEYSTSRIAWLRTTHPVVSVNTALRHGVHVVHAALSQGVRAIVDACRRDFYEIEIGNRWYYIHVVERLKRVFVIAAVTIPAPAPEAEILRTAAV